MKKTEYSFGIIPLKLSKGEWQTLLIQHHQGHWAFPKGHADPHEVPYEAAVRELREETALQVAHLLDIPPIEEEYFFRAGPDLVHKKVLYFAAQVTGEVIIQQQEITDYKWLPLKDAHGWATFKETQTLCATLIKRLVGMDAS